MRLKAEIAGAQLPEELLEREFSQARNIGKVQLGESCLFFKKFSGATYLPYGESSGRGCARRRLRPGCAALPPTLTSFMW